VLKLRSLFQKSKVSFAPLEINGMIRELYPLIQSQLLMRQIEFTDDLELDVAMILGDRTQLQQVLINLLFNGVEAMKDSNERQLRVSSRFMTDSLIVRVSDTGPGIPEKILPHVFEPFFTTKDEGMGMGLSINKTIIDQHGGSIWVENNQDRGATFSFSLPLAPAPANGKSA
jgi:signal transduction histidine kinase